MVGYVITGDVNKRRLKSKYGGETMGWILDLSF